MASRGIKGGFEFTSARLKRPMHSAQQPTDGKRNANRRIGLVLDDLSRCRLKGISRFAGCGAGSVGDIGRLFSRLSYGALEALLLICVWHDRRPRPL
jgi:hypothetical protein